MQDISLWYIRRGREGGGDRREERIEIKGGGKGEGKVSRKGKREGGGGKKGERKEKEGDRRGMRRTETGLLHSAL